MHNSLEKTLNNASLEEGKKEEEKDNNKIEYREFVFRSPESQEEYNIRVHRGESLDGIYKKIGEKSGGKGEVPEGLRELVDIFSKEASIKVKSGNNAERRPHLLIAGGFVRDIMMDKTPKDVDLASNLEPEEVEKLILDHYLGEGHSSLSQERIEEELDKKDVSIDKTGKQFMVVRLKVKGEEYEIATFRQDGEYVDGRRPENTEPVMRPGDDASRRDFTINSMYYNPLSGNVIDYTGGLKDINEEKLRFVGDARKRIEEDKLRILRCARFALKTGFSPDQEAVEASRENVSDLGKVSKERIKEEMDKAISCSRPDQFLDVLDELGALAKVMPEIYSLKECEQGPPYHLEGNVFEHTRLVGRNLPVNSSKRLKWAAIFHDIGKPEARQEKDEGQESKKVSFLGHDAIGSSKAISVMKEMKFKNKEIKEIEWMIKKHNDIFQNTLDRFLSAEKHGKMERAQKRAHKYFINLFRDNQKNNNGDTSLSEDLLRLCSADNLGRLKKGYSEKEWREEALRQNDLIQASFLGAKDDFENNPKYKIIDNLKLGNMIKEEAPEIDKKNIGQVKDFLEGFLIGEEFSTKQKAVKIAAKVLRAEKKRFIK